jgi:hypothetical protein
MIMKPEWARGGCVPAVARDACPLPRSKGVDAAFTLLYQHERGIHTTKATRQQVPPVTSNPPGAQGHQAFGDTASVGASRTGDFMISVDSFGRYAGEAAHDHGSASAR